MILKRIGRMERKSNYVKVMACVFSVIMLVALIPVGIAQAATVKAWEFNTDGNVEGWAPFNCTGTVTGGYLTGTVSAAPSLYSPDNLGVDSSSYKVITIRMKNQTTATVGHVYFITTTDTTLNTAKLKLFPIKASDSGYTEYTIDMSTVTTWTGTIRRLRVDPGDSTTGTFSIDYVRIQNTGYADMYVYNVTSGGTAIYNLNQLAASNNILSGVAVYTDQSKPVTLILAVYKSGKLNKVEFSSTVTANAGARTQVTTPQITLPSGNLQGCLVKSFLWSNLTNLTPLVSAPVELQ